VLAAVALWHVEEPGELLISSGLAALGFALPAAAAAALVLSDPRVICFMGGWWHRDGPR
jgi:acetolactate synthase-1/2/3 large subunit